MLFSSLALALLLAADFPPVQAKNHALSRLPRHHDLSERMLVHSNNTEIKPRSTGRKCKPRPATKAAASTSKSATNAATTTTRAATTTTKAATKGTIKATTTTTRPETKVTTESTPAPTRGSSSGNILGVAFKPSDWPTATQAGPAPAETRASAADPFLLELSKAYNNKNNPSYTKTYTGDMTWYDQGLGSCGDTYDDSSYTAAVSHILYDSWPGATDKANSNPICGPYVPGRQSIGSSGSFFTSVPGSSYVEVGGDGLLSCATGKSQCHIPLTATVMHGDSKIIVSIVDRCAACKEGDIDLTPTAFAALADINLGRTSVTWRFNEF